MSPMGLKYYVKMAVHGSLMLSPWPDTVRSSLSVFTYHSFCFNGSPPMDFPSLPVAMFERQIGVLKRRYHLVGLSDGLRILREGGERRSMATITLDDGFADNYQVAWPVLHRLEVPATIFLATDFIDQQRVPWPTRLWDVVNAIEGSRARGGRSDPGISYQRYQETLRVLPGEVRLQELERLIAEHRLYHLPVRRAMSWSQIREMSAAGIEFGSHTVFHGLLPFLEPSEVAFELTESRRRLEEQIQIPCAYFAYPNGDYSPAVCAQAERIGYRAALTQSFGANCADMDAFRLKRIEVPYHDPLPSFSRRARKALTQIPVEAAPGAGK